MKKEVTKKKKSLDTDLAACKEKVQELELNWKRAVADYQNLKRRAEEDRLKIIKFANFELLSELLPVLDNFESLLKHSDDQGLKVTVKHFVDTLKNVGVEELNVLGKDFDADTCEALELVPGKKNIVIDVLQKGYTYQGRLLRPAKVNVGKGK